MIFPSLYFDRGTVRSDLTYALAVYSALTTSSCLSPVWADLVTVPVIYGELQQHV